MAKNISKTLIIGLGGTGQTVIREIKKRMLRTYGEIPDLVKFLAFDTDELKNENTSFKYYYNGVSHDDFKYHIQGREFKKILDPGLDAVRRDAICAAHLNIDELANVSNRLSGRGANGYRIIGRSHFLNDSLYIINLLSDKVGELNDARRAAACTAAGYNIVNNNVTAYVIASLAGGTGSSAFQDMSRMLQIAGVNTQYATAAGQDMIFGVFFLPSFFKNYANTENIEVNAYTALSELDYTLDLGDATRFPVGSQALADDNQDYHGNTGNGKRVHYSGVFLIDSKTSTGQTHEITDASSYVASFIASSIAATSNDILSSYVNSFHKTHTVQGKYQKYSTLGYCELRFNRQELVRYLLNRKLLESLSYYKGGVNAFVASEIAQAFIDTNHLNEGVESDSEGNDTRSQMNELTDAIINMNDERFSSITMAGVDTGKNADANIEAKKTTYLNLIGAKANEVVREFGTKKMDLCLKLRETLDKYQVGMGFGSFPDLALSLTNSFVVMKKGLEDELESHERKYNELVAELQIIKNTISENSSRGFRGNKREKQEAAIQSYCHKVRFTTGSGTNPTLAWLKVESARKAEAIAVFGELINIVKEYYKKEIRETINGNETINTGTYLQIDGMYDSLDNLLTGENNCYRPTLEAINETVFADAYFKNYFESHWDNALTFTEQAERNFYEYIGSLFSDQPTADANLLSQMREKLLELLGNDDIVKRIHGYTQTTKDANGTVTTTKVIMSIDELFIHCFGTYGKITNPQDLDNNPQLKLLRQVVSLFDPLWSYVNFKGEEGSLQPSKCMLYGVYEMQRNIFDAVFGGYSAILPSDLSMRPVGLGDPDRITFMLAETAIPAFKLVDAEAWASEFKQKKNQIYTFTDRNLEEIDMITPNVNEEGEIAWAYGWLFGLITNPERKRGIRVKPTYAYMTRKSGRTYDGDGSNEYNYFATTQNNSDIAVCHRKFINDEEISKDIYEQAMAELTSNPPACIIRIKKWVNDGGMWNRNVRGKERGSMRPAELEVIQNEIQHLAKRFVRLLGFNLTLDHNGKVNHPYSSALELLEKEDKESEKKANPEE
jgi:hypothetical protein